ncbi:CENP-B N and/or HTH 28 domain containing protein [Asbolus verrucosus]|uniref:CENP-B N and/or HTH 28 domain containing protein n=1 Tax=Asbolus verrucosus TaxID=1661398 RepID=A0A482VYF4_ASBVE|nr:CENP-B N and/or HTH 28 domain containing protein [Asbolus verrucosus]
MSGKNAKRSVRAISAHGKLEAIRRVHDGESKASVARDIGVPESTLRGWCKNESKISYLSRQSSPDTDESVEPKEKRPKIEDSAMIQPFNLSLKSSTGMYTPNSSESLYTPMDYAKGDMDCTPKTPQNLSIKTETPKSTASQGADREPKNKNAALTRLCHELGLNKPEMFSSNSSYSELAVNVTLLAQWNNILMQHQLLQNGQNKRVAAADTTTAAAAAATSSGSKQNVAKPPKEQQSMEDYVNGWLKTQEAAALAGGHSRQNLPNGLSPTPMPAATSAGGTSSLNVAAAQNSWFWSWYKRAYAQQAAANAANAAGLPPVSSEKPILYQQLTKDANDAENLTIEKPVVVNNTRMKSVLDNLLHMNNNNVSVEKKPEKEMSYAEAIEHGDKFLGWLESISHPSVTAMQIMQFRTLLNNVKNSVDRRNGDLQNKTKVKRK